MMMMIMMMMIRLNESEALRRGAGIDRHACIVRTSYECFNYDSVAVARSRTVVRTIESRCVACSSAISSSRLFHLAPAIISLGRGYGRVTSADHGMDRFGYK